MLPLNAELINQEKLVSCYLKKMNIDFNKREPYDNMTKELLEDTIREIWDVKGELNYKSLLPAKKIDHPETEHELQVRVVKYLRSKHIPCFAVPNGFHFNGDKITSARYINYMKAEGLTPGMFDICILTGNGQIAFLELKTSKGKPSEKQLQFLEWFEKHNYKAKIAFGYEQAIEFIESLESEA